MQRTAAGMLPVKLLNKKGSMFLHIKSLLSPKNSNCSTESTSKDCVRHIFALDSILFVIHVCSLIAAACIAVAMILTDISPFLTWTNWCFQLLIWYFYFNTMFSPIHPLPFVCHNLYEKNLRMLYTLCLEDEPMEDLLHSSDKLSALCDIDSSLCHICHCVKPLHARHVFHLNRCVLDLDHYCFFLKTTVCRDNYTWFFGYLLSMSIGMLWFFVTVNSVNEQLSEVLNEHFVTIFYTYTIYAWFCMFGFTFCQMVLLLLGVTMNEYLMKVESDDHSTSVVASNSAHRNDNPGKQTHKLPLTDRLQISIFFCKLSPLLKCLLEWIFAGFWTDSSSDREKKSYFKTSTHHGGPTQLISKDTKETTFEFACGVDMSCLTECLDSNLCHQDSFMLL